MHKDIVGPTGVLFLMSEVSLYLVREIAAVGPKRDLGDESHVWEEHPEFVRLRTPPASCLHNTSIWSCETHETLMECYGYTDHHRHDYDYLRTLVYLVIHDSG